MVCLGCAHSGVINTLEYVQRMTHGAALRAVIGGFHLMNAEPSRIRHTMTALRAFGIKTLVPCHCTGDSATTLLKEAFGHAVSPGGVAATFSF